MLESEDTQPEVAYAIDLAWFRERSRTFASLARSRACSECAQQFGKEADAESILSRFSQCCAQTPGFLRPHQPLMEAVFRLFLIKKNKPLTIEEISQELNRWGVKEGRPVEANTLRRLLDSDRFYGIKPRDKPVA